MPELPPPPPPPLSFAGVLADAARRAFARAADRTGVPAAAGGTVHPLAPTPSAADGDDALLAVPAARDTSPVAAFTSAVSPLALACGALVVAVVGGWLLLQHFTEPSDPPEITLPRAAPSATAAASGADPDIDPTSAGAASPSGSAEPARPRGPVTVHAAGAVAQPGVYRLPPTARVADLIQAAGGATGDAVVDALNLAAPLGDGMRVYVPRHGELPPGALLALAEGAGTSTDVSGNTGPGPPDRPVDLNTATLEQLDALPGVGPTTAQAILDYRRTNGRFRSVDELLEVRGIGPSRLQTLRKKVRV